MFPWSPGYHAPLDLYPEFYRIAKDPSLHSVPEGRPVVVCVGKEWHRFPSSFLLPHKSEPGFFVQFIYGTRVSIFGSLTSFSSQNLQLATSLHSVRVQRAAASAVRPGSSGHSGPTGTHERPEPGGADPIRESARTRGRRIREQTGVFIGTRLPRCRWIYGSATTSWTWTRRRRRRWSRATPPTRRSGASSPPSRSFEPRGTFHTPVIYTEDCESVNPYIKKIIPSGHMTFIILSILERDPPLLLS